MEQVVTREVLIDGLTAKSYNLTQKEIAFYAKKLQEDAKVFLQKNFGLELKIPIFISNRFKRLGGGFTHTRSGIPVDITISGKQIKYSTMDENGYENILDILYHECVHYALCVLGKDFDDGSKEFEETLARLNVPSSGTTRESKIMSTKSLSYYTIGNYTSYDYQALYKVTINLKEKAE